MQLIFTLTSFIGLVIFAFKKRRFDFFSLGFVSACIYFLPGYFGFVIKPVANYSFKYRVPINDESYVVMTLVLITILLGSIVYDHVKLAKKEINVTFPGTTSIIYVMLFVSVFGLIMTLIFGGHDLFSPDKTIVLNAMGRWWALWTVSASLGTIISFNLRRSKFFWIFLVLLIPSLYMGVRVELAITIISFMLMWLWFNGRQRIILANFKTIVFGLFLALMFFIYKELHWALHLKMWGRVAEILTNPQYYVVSIINSEPFVTQAILNEVVNKDFFVGPSHLTGIIYQFILFAPELGAKKYSFNDLFQPVLFPGLDFGMASNIWAEMISSGGWLLFVTFLLFYVAILGIFSYLLKYNDPLIRAVVTLTGSYWAFYIHRNDFAYILNIEKRILVVALFCFLSSILVSIVCKKQKSHNINAS